MSLCLALILSLSAFDSKADIYYVIDGESFTLTPSVNNLFQYLWVLDPASGSPISTTLDQASGGVYTRAVTLAAPAVAETHTLTLSVLGVVDGCLSDLVTHTIIVLPKITVSVTASKSNFCLNLPVDASLTASVTAVTGLGTYGVTLSPFVWSKDGSVITGETTSTLAVTTPGVYKALVSYVLPTTGSYIPTGSKLTNAINGLTTTILHNLPVATVPSISIN